MDNRWTIIVKEALKKTNMVQSSKCPSSLTILGSCRDY